MTKKHVSPSQFRGEDTPKYIENFECIGFEYFTTKQKTDISNLCSFITLCEKAVPNVPSYETLRPSFYELRSVMFKALPLLKSNKDIFSKFARLCQAVHLLCLLSSIEQSSDGNLFEYAAKCSVSLLRYCDILPCDYLFYKAGTMMQKMKRNEEALLFYTRLADIFEAINSGNASDIRTLDNSNFQNSSIPDPSRYFVRKKSYIQQSFIDKTNEWILDLTVSSQIEAKLPLRSCQKCGRQIFEADLVCPLSKADCEMCYITGYPIVDERTQLATCTACGITANKKDWVNYINIKGRCPLCNSKQIVGN